MKNLNFKKQIGFVVVFMLFVTSVINAQSKIIPQNSTVTILGTSSVHDWQEKVTKIDGDITVNSSQQISALNIKIPVTSIKSDKDTMNEKTYEAFNSKKNPNIVFQLTEITAAKISETATDITLTGNLSMAGATRKITFKSSGNITKSGDYHLKGSVPLKMTDFNMKPPTAMMGTMKTGNAITVKFDVLFNKM
jgi:polyisoprenoid-binding protein YceI